ncbi:MAG: hypothetical protein KAH23_05790, partial [Kiritimatiellae bacterium]|nr:hypothetical protein [Kiritimatiellia bacterium]
MNVWQMSHEISENKYTGGQKLKYGRFSKDGSEYIVTRPDTPRPWYNRFGNSEYSVIISQTGGGFAVAGNSHQYLVNWYIPRYDEAGRFLYVRDDETGDFWSVGYAPVRKKLDHFECRHGLGWTTFVARRKSIECKMTVFVPLDGAVELWNVELTNLSKRKRKISVFPFVEWSIEDVPQGADDLVYAAHSDGDFEPATSSIVASYRYTTSYIFAKAFLTTDMKIKSWDVNRASFVGNGRTLANPLALERGKCTKTPAYAEISVGALSGAFSLKPKQSAEFTVMSGMADTKKKRTALRRRFFKDGASKRELARVKDFWTDINNNVEIRTPDKKFDRYVNRWLVRHVYTMGTTHAVRYLGKGFRNYMQDALGLLNIDPSESRRIILEAMKYQLTSGECLHRWSLSRMPHTPPAHVDPKIWLPLTTCFYIKNSNDFDILKHRERFHDSAQRASLLDRLYLILDKAWKELGPHGLSLIKRGDWNDSLDGMGRKGRGESVWMSMAVYWTLKEVAEIARKVGDKRRCNT